MSLLGCGAECHHSRRLKPALHGVVPVTLLFTPSIARVLVLEGKMAKVLSAISTSLRFTCAPVVVTSSFLSSFVFLG